MEISTVLLGILFLQKCLLNSSSHFIRLLSELLFLIGCRGNINSLIFEKNLFMALVTSLVVLFYCCVTADILTKLLQQCFLIFIVVPWFYLGNSQVSVYRTIGPTLVTLIWQAENEIHVHLLLDDGIMALNSLHLSSVLTNLHNVIIRIIRSACVSYEGRSRIT